MKKLLLTALLIPAFALAQDDVRMKTISPYFSISEPTAVGISFESAYIKSDSLPHKWTSSKFANVAATMMTYEDGGFSADGNGFLLELGSRTYFNQQWNGIYMENSISYSATKFDEAIAPGVKFKGTYSYFSMFAPAVGYKIMIGDKFSIDPSVGFIWKWEIKGRGDIDNNNTDAFVFKAGAKIGYSF